MICNNFTLNFFNLVLFQEKSWGAGSISSYHSYFFFIVCVLAMNKVLDFIPPPINLISGPSCLPLPFVIWNSHLIFKKSKFSSQILNSQFEKHRIIAFSKCNYSEIFQVDHRKAKFRIIILHFLFLQFKPPGTFSPQYKQQDINY